MMDNLGQPDHTGDKETRTAQDTQHTEDTGSRTPQDAQDIVNTDSRIAQDTQDTEGKDSRTSQDTQDTGQMVSLNTTQAGQQLGVDGRTVRRYITDGIRTASGTVIRLQARQVSRGHGPEWQIYQEDLERFKQQRDQIATEGQTAGQLMREAEASQALTTISVQLLATELERRTLALQEAQATIERLALEAGRQTGRSEELESERNALRQRVRELEEERDQWKQKAQQKPRRIRLLPWSKED